MTEKKLSRRDAMKILGAAIGGAALSTLPPQWSKPALAASELPAHARQSAHGMHTIAADPLNTNALCSSGEIISEAGISPVAIGIPLRYTITSNMTITAPASLSGQIDTLANGRVTLTIIVASIPNTGGDITVEWSFVNPSDGLGSSSQTLIELGC